MADDLKQRSEIDNKFKWDLGSMYSNDQKWENDLMLCGEKAKEFLGYQGKIGESAETLLAVMKLKDFLMEKAENVIVYAMMRRDEDKDRKSTRLNSSH